MIPRDEARLKIRAAVEARDGADILIMARTDARSSIGFAEAMARVRDFEAEGADILFAEALETEAELREFGGGFSRPTWANMMPKTPVASRAALRAMGFKVVTYNVLLHAAIRAMRDTLAALKDDDIRRAPPPGVLRRADGAGRARRVRRDGGALPRAGVGPARQAW